MELLLPLPSLHTVDITTDKHYIAGALKHFLPLLRRDSFRYLVAICATLDRKEIETLGEEMANHHMPLDQQAKVYEKIIWITEPGLKGDFVKSEIPALYLESHARYYEEQRNLATERT